MKSILTRILKLINFSQTDQEKFEKTQVKNIKNVKVKVSVPMSIYECLF